MTTFRNTPTRPIAAFGLVLALAVCGALSSRRMAAETDDTGPSPRGATPGRLPGALPLRFEANRGQTDSRVRFLSRGQGYTLFLTATDAIIALDRESAVGDAASNFVPGAPRTPAARDLLTMKIVN